MKTVQEIIVVLEDRAKLLRECATPDPDDTEEDKEYRRRELLQAMQYEAIVKWIKE